MHVVIVFPQLRILTFSYKNSLSSCKKDNFPSLHEISIDAVHLTRALYSKYGINEASEALVI